MYIKLRIYLKGKLYKTPITWKCIEFFQGLVYLFDYVRYYKAWGHDRRFSIREINIEFASNCNLRCKFCSLDHTKPKNLISEDILRQFLHNFIVDKRFQKVEIINLHNGGEILLHPKRLELLSILKEYKELARKKRIKFPKIFFLTNGMLLREKLSQDILNLEVIDTMGFSLDGGTKEAFEEMRENAKWDVIYANIKAFQQLNAQANNPIETYALSCIEDDKVLNTNWMEDEFKEILHLLDRYELRRLHNWAGEVDSVAQRKEKRHKIGCTLLMRQMVLLPNGDVTICCNDLNSKAVIGNIMDQDVMKIYKSDKRKKYLKALLKRRKSTVDLCRDCETF